GCFLMGARGRASTRGHPAPRRATRLRDSCEDGWSAPRRPGRARAAGSRDAGHSRSDSASAQPRAIAPSSIPMPFPKYRRLLWFALSACAGCAATRPTVADVAEAECAVEDAETAGANDTPNASLYLALARNELTRAQERLDHGDRTGAVRWAKRATADADMAT